MERQDNGVGRRALLSTTVFGAGSLLVPGIGAANPGRGRPEDGNRRGPPEHAEAPPWAQIQNGQLEMGISEEEWERSDPTEIEGVPEDAEVIPYEAAETVVEGINKDVRAGEIQLGDGESGRPTSGKHPGKGRGRQ